MRRDSGRLSQSRLQPLPTPERFGTVQIPLVLPAPNTFQRSYRGVAYAIIGTKNEAQPHLISYNVSVQQQLPAPDGADGLPMRDRTASTCTQSIRG